VDEECYDIRDRAAAAPPTRWASPDPPGRRHPQVDTMIDTRYRHSAVSAGRDMQETALTEAARRTTSCTSRPRPGADTARYRQTESINPPGHRDIPKPVTITGTRTG